MNPDSKEQIKADNDCLESLRETLNKLRAAKPEDRGELARSYAVAITELEKVFAYFYTFIAVEGDA